MSDELLTYEQAATYLAFCVGTRPQRYVENYVRSGELTRPGRRRLILKSSLDDLLSQRQHSLVTNYSPDDYRMCLNFAVSSFYHYPSHADLLVGGRQRGIGEWAEDFVPGKLAEIGFSSFVEKTFGVKLVLDFTLRTAAIVGQDVTEVIRTRKGLSVANPPKLRISVKQTQTKGIWLAVTQGEGDDPQRTSDVYVLVRVELTGDHLFRYLRSHPGFDDVRNLIPDSVHAQAWVVGYALRDDLQLMGTIPEIGATTPRYALMAGQLHKSSAEWKKLVCSL